MIRVIFIMIMKMFVTAPVIVCYNCDWVWLTAPVIVWYWQGRYWRQPILNYWLPSFKQIFDEYSSKYSIFDALETQAHHNKSLNSSEKNIRQLSRKKKCQWMYIIIYIHAYIKYVINNTQINCFRNLQIEPNSDRNYKTFLIDLSSNGIFFAVRWNGKIYNLSSVWFIRKQKFMFVCKSV